MSAVATQPDIFLRISGTGSFGLKTTAGSHPETGTGVPLARLKFGANWDKIIIAHRNRRSSAAGHSPHEEQDSDGGSVKMRSAGAFG